MEFTGSVEPGTLSLTLLAMAVVNIINGTGIKRHIRNMIVYLGRCLTGINLETTFQSQRSMYI